MNGRRLMIGFLAVVALFAAGLIWFQFFAFYERTGSFAPVAVGEREIDFADYEGIDATSSPLKLRGCFAADPADFAGLDPVEDATPLTPPPWFRCFDAETIARDVEAGRAAAYRLASDSPEGFDLMAAVYPDGRGYLWRQLGPKFAD